MAWEPPPNAARRLDELAGTCPDARALCLPALHLVQEELGHVPPECFAWIARRLSTTAGRVRGVATFYGMFRRAPAGKHHLEVCTNISCALCGAGDVLRAVEEELGVKAGQTTPDGLFSLAETECLATCGMGPAMQVGDELYEGLTPGAARELVARLRKRG